MDCHVDRKQDAVALLVSLLRKSESVAKSSSAWLSARMKPHSIFPKAPARFPGYGLKGSAVARTRRCATHIVPTVQYAVRLAANGGDPGDGQPIVSA